MFLSIPRTRRRRGRLRQFRPEAQVPALSTDSLEIRCLLTTQTVDVSASLDNTIYEHAPESSNGLGQFLLTGSQSSEGRTWRGLVEFDIESAGIPEGATIIDAVLYLNLAQSLGPSAAVAVHQVGAAWGEAGSDDVGSEQNGAPAQQNDATWGFRFFDGAAWSTLGGDFDAASAVTEVDSLGVYEWSGGGVIDDVQQWLDAPSTNHGWLLAGPEGSENIKGFTSSNSVNVSLAPLLRITYEEPLLPGTVEGRIWHDVNADGIRIPADISNLNLQFHNGRTYFNSFGGKEYWLKSQVNGSWYFLTEDGTLTRWNGQSKQLTGDTLTRVDPRVYYSASLLVENPEVLPEPWLNGWTVELLDESGSVIGSTQTVNRDLDGNGSINEESESGWYVFEGLNPADYEVRQIPPEGWVQSGSWTAPESESVYDLKQSLGLRYNGTYYENSGQTGERWLRGTGAWYYVNPTGDFYRWDNESITAANPLDGTMVAQLGQSYFRDPSLIFLARSPTLSVQPGEVLSRVDFGNFEPVTVSGRQYLDFDGDGARSAGDPFGGGLGIGIGGPPESLEGTGASWFFNAETESWFLVTDTGEFIPYTSGDSLPADDGAGFPVNYDAEPPPDAEPHLNGRIFELLDSHGNVLDTIATADRDLNDNQLIEIEDERGWYEFADLLPGTYSVRPRSVEGFPETGRVSESEAAVARAMQQRHGFKFASSDSYNWGGQHERWFAGRNSRFFFVTPDGKVYSHDSTANKQNFFTRATLLADLSSAFFVNMNQLMSPESSETTLSSGDVLTEFSFGSYSVRDGVFSDIGHLLDA